jgi:hypothetical protein
VHGVGDQGQNTMVAHMHTLGIWVVHIFTGDRALCVYGGGVHGWGLGDSSNRLMAHMRTLSIAVVHIYSGGSTSCSTGGGVHGVGDQGQTQQIGGAHAHAWYLGGPHTHGTVT